MDRISFLIDKAKKRQFKAFIAERGLSATQVLLWCINSILDESIDLSPLWLESVVAPLEEVTGE